MFAKYLRVLTGAKPCRKLVLLGLASEALYLTFALSFSLPAHWAGPLVDLGNMNDYSAQVFAGYIAFIVSLFGLFWLGYRILAECGTNQARLVIFAFTVAFHVTLIPMYPVTATDLFDYVFHMRIATHYHQNPLILCPGDFPNDIFFWYVSSSGLPTPYGPVWITLNYLPSLLGGDNLLLNLLLFKAVAVMFSLACIGLVYAILSRIRPGSRLEGAYIAAWNPLLIWEAAGNGHNDVIMALFLLLGLYLLVLGRKDLALPALTLSALAKFTTILLVPLFLLFLVRKTGGWRKKALFLMKTLLLSAALAALLYSPFWEGPSTLSILGRLDMFIGSFPALFLYTLELRLGPETSRAIVKALAAVAFGIAYIRVMLLRPRTISQLVRAAFWTMLSYLMLASFWFMNWYLIWLVLLVALADEELTAPMGLLSFTALLSYAIYIFVWVWNWERLNILALHLITVPLTFGGPLFLLLRGRMGMGREPLR